MHRFITTAVVLFLFSVAAPAQLPEALTLESALARARQSAPAVIAARLRIAEARAHLLGASLPLQSNPTVNAAGGRRSGNGESSPEYEFELGQNLDLPGRRTARRAAARAVVTQEEQRALETEREALQDVAATFLRALEAKERLDVATSAKSLADETVRVAERRFSAGDVAQLDVNIARTASAAARAQLRAADAAHAGRITELRVLLGYESKQPIDVSGSLRDLPQVADASLIENLRWRPDIRALEAEIAEAEAETRLAQTLRWPDLDVRGSYRREQNDTIVLGGVGISLPVFNRGQEATAVASARLARLRAEREALIRSAETELRGALDTYEKLRSATSEYEQIVVPLLAENEKLALESYEVGQIGLSELILVRRETLDARRVFIDQLIETRLAAIELQTRAGVLK